MADEFLHFDTFLEDAERWRNRAEEMRMIAEEMISEHNKAVALRLADSYERLAELAEKRARSK
jgi:hypothetical protein